MLKTALGRTKMCASSAALCLLLAFSNLITTTGCGQITPYSPDALHQLAQEWLEDDPTQEESTDNPDEILAIGMAIQAMGFEDPTLPEDQKLAILANYAHLDKKKVVPRALLEKAIIYYHVNLARLPRSAHIGVIDYSRPSNEERFFIVNMKTGAVWSMHVAHGSGSDADHDGKPECYSNNKGSNATSLGAYLGSELYKGKWGLSMRLDGLHSTNSNARARAVVVHGAPYVRDADVLQGRSWGCPAVAFGNRDRVMELLKNGSLIYVGLTKPNGSATLTGPLCRSGR